MRLARVIGNVVSTRKEDALIGFKLLVLEELDPRTENPTGTIVVAVDTLGAGVTDLVIYTVGGAARVISEAHRKAPVDTAIVGIVDTVSAS